MRTSGRPTRSASLSVRVSFICTANRARSPFAAALLRRHLAGLPVLVESFGTLELAGAQALTGAMKAARPFAIDLAGHRSRPLPPGALVGTDLAIGFEPYHVASAVVTGGAPSSRAFLLAELADALQDTDASTPIDAAGRLEALVALAHDHRTAAAVLPRSIPDPVRASDRRFLATFHEIDRLVAIVAARLLSAMGDPTG